MSPGQQSGTERVDPRCRKSHRPRIDFKSLDLHWYCETCHEELVATDNPFSFVVAKGREAIADD